MKPAELSSLRRPIKPHRIVSGSPLCRNQSDSDENLMKIGSRYISRPKIPTYVYLYIYVYIYVCVYPIGKIAFRSTDFQLDTLIYHGSNHFSIQSELRIPPITVTDSIPRQGKSELSSTRKTRGYRSSLTARRTDGNSFTCGDHGLFGLVALNRRRPRCCSGFTTGPPPDRFLLLSVVHTYQDSHFCSRDIPGASRSELDADCRCFVALYTRHTFAFATRARHAVPPTLHLFVRVERPRSAATTPLWETHDSPPHASRQNVPLPCQRFRFLLLLLRHHGSPTCSAHLPLVPLLCGCLLSPPMPCQSFPPSLDTFQLCLYFPFLFSFFLSSSFPKVYA